MEHNFYSVYRYIIIVHVAWCRDSKKWARPISSHDSSRISSSRPEILNLRGSKAPYSSSITASSKLSSRTASVHKSIFRLYLAQEFRKLGWGANYRRDHLFVFTWQRRNFELDWRRNQLLSQYLPASPLCQGEKSKKTIIAAHINPSWKQIWPPPVNLRLDQSALEGEG